MSDLANIGWMGGLAIYQRVIGTLGSALFARTLGATDFGVLTIVNTTTSSAYGLFRLSVDASLQVEVASRPDRVQQTLPYVFAGMVLLGIAGALAWMAVLMSAKWVAGSVYGSAPIAPMLQFAGPLVFAQCLCQFVYAVLAGANRFDIYARWTMAVSTIGLITSGAAAWWGNLQLVLMVMVVTQMINAVVLLRVLTVLIDWKAGIPSLSVSVVFAAARTLLRTGLPYYASGFVLIPVTYGLQGMLGQAGGIEAVGYQRILIAMCSVVGFLPHSIAGVVVSSLAAARGHGQPTDTIDRQAAITLKLIWLATVIVAIAVIAAMPWLIGLLFGAPYLPATGPARVACVAAVFASVGQVGIQDSVAARRFGIVLKMAVVHAIVFLLLGVALIPENLLFGYAIAELAAHGCVLVAVLVEQRARYKGRRSALAACIVLTALLATSPLWFPSGAAAVAISALVLEVILGGLLFFVLFSDAERAVVLRRMSTILRKRRTGRVKGNATGLADTTPLRRWPSGDPHA
ncbi:lipopolysaccharide biosynthesis protein [Tahibacter amnicola]|uniref:Lipopolysaccharide biosynthesis protein n=1 Tax=Tahibacter amnicola TaxID=2976241 RepID=A0ABY6B943_9GAMM|nr:lipopolysaccharide biosynthesis protein [Tahibacter amnicola]UXI66389.1 lipopolysaccharide biosynthesis protein [Tahibacter amnicola]